MARRPALARCSSEVLAEWLREGLEPSLKRGVLPPEHPLYTDSSMGSNCRLALRRAAAAQHLLHGVALHLLLDRVYLGYGCRAPIVRYEHSEGVVELCATPPESMLAAGPHLPLTTPLPELELRLAAGGAWLDAHRALRGAGLDPLNVLLGHVAYFVSHVDSLAGGASRRLSKMLPNNARLGFRAPAPVYPGALLFLVVAHDCDTRAAYLEAARLVFNDILSFYRGAPSRGIAARWMVVDVERNAAATVVHAAGSHALGLLVSRLEDLGCSVDVVLVRRVVYRVPALRRGGDR